MTDERDRTHGCDRSGHSGCRALGTIARSFEANASTNDRGEYRITVDPGRYAVFVEVDHATSDPSAFGKMIDFGEGARGAPKAGTSPLHVEQGHGGLISPVPDSSGRTMTHVTTFAPEFAPRRSPNNHGRSRKRIRPASTYGWCSRGAFARRAVLTA